ncbi:uncharacterized protein LOC135442355 isoform X2 [Zonotrichia leucophrys gambelii]
MSPVRAAILLTLSSLTAAWIVPQPRQNIWVTLAEALQQENICLSTAAAKDPMSTCLVGIPLQAGEFPAKSDTPMPDSSPKSHHAQPQNTHQKQAVMIRNPIEEWLPKLPRAAQEPQELELLGSSPAPYCIHFFFIPLSNTKPFNNIIQYQEEFTGRRWCKVLSHVTADNPYYSHPKSLPKGLFLICGDRAWSGIPSQLLGGPCTIGRLSLLAPNQTMIGKWTRKNNSVSKIQMRSIDNLDPNCDAEVFHWAKSKKVAVSLFLPWVAAAKALGELGHLECWVVRQANLTSTAISSFLEDEEITRQAKLQNRAAIDFLLLLHGHECQEFEGLCCLNLASKAPNIHAALREVKSLIGRVKQESEDWFSGLFKDWGLSGWWTSVIRTILLFLVVLFLVVLAFGILRHILLKAINGSVSSTSEVTCTEFVALKQIDRPANDEWRMNS